MDQLTYRALSLFGRDGSRKYLNQFERDRFLESVQRLPSKDRLLCLTLAWSGARISEVLALTAIAIDLDAGAANIICLKRRRSNIVRQVPLPRHVLADLDCVFQLRQWQGSPIRASERLWCWSRTTAWRCVKRAMADAGICGIQATAKGLRHAFGVRAFQRSVPDHLVQRWLGHASPATTAIYGDVVGPDEREFATRMWDDTAPPHPD